MSAFESFLPTQPPFVSTLSPMPYEHLLTGPEGWASPYEKLFHLSRSVAAMPREVLSRNLVALFRPLFPCDLVNIVILNPGADVSWSSLGAGQLAHAEIPVEATTVGSVYQEQEPLWVVDCQQDERAAVRDEAKSAAGAGYRSLCRLPLSTPQGCFGVLSIAGSRPHQYTDQEVRLLTLAAEQVALGLANSLLHADLQKLKGEVGGDEEVNLPDASDAEISFEEIVGRSPALQRALRQVEVVAPTDSGVLIQGETGTGKELIAQAIHNRSARRNQPFVKLNCAAIPSGLLESELFGHEKGAFTGAIMRKPGRFEAADKGTIFLDEVGDIPLELQSKLLRVLQEHEFERLGSTRTQQVDVRVIAATHRDLKQMVEEGTFRRDLYYRLLVFPLMVPPLRERREDIPLIVRHYVEKYARKMNRPIETIPARTMETLTSHSWPGNVRELQNFIERAVILSPGNSLRAPLEELKQESMAAQTPHTNLSTLEEMEREHVLRALREANWVTGGPNGAAVRLGMKRTTLAYRIRKLGIPIRPQ